MFLRHISTIFFCLILSAGFLSACSGALFAAATPTPTPTQDNNGGVISGEATVEQIDIRILESFPVQVHVGVRGYLADGCTEIDEMIQSREGNTFNVTITTTRPADAMCTMALVPFEQNIPLDVEGLPAGTYTVMVNGVSGTFELSVDNVLK
jgi:inhibitor of cysteine peptidase